MRVLLLSSTIENRFRSKTINENSHYPLGLGYLHSYLEKQGHTVHTLFLNDYPYVSCKSIILHEIKRFLPDVIGLNIITSNRLSSFRLIQYFHKTYPFIHIVIGGVHATVMYTQILKRFPYVVAVLGEGENTLKELIDSLGQSKSFWKILGIAYVRKRTVIKTKDRGLISNLDTIPYPKHEVFFSPHRTIASMVTSRGCPFHCSFCVLNAISRGYPRFRSIHNIIGEIEYLIRSYPQLETIWFHDDQFFLDNQRVIAMCHEIVKRNIKLKFICSGRFKPVSNDMVHALERAGFIQILFGLESGSPTILNLCHKYITHNDVIRTVTLFKKSKIILSVFLIIGLYGETDATINETIQFVQKIQRIKYLFFDDIALLVIYPGTEIYEIAKKAGNIKDSYWLQDKPTPYFTVTHSYQKLSLYKNKVLNAIAMKRLCTPFGFISQLVMIPWIIKFLVISVPRYPLYSMHVFQRFSPSAYFLYSKMFRNHSNTKSMKKLK